MDYEGPTHIVDGYDIERARVRRTPITTLCGITYVPTETIVSIPNRGVCEACLEARKANK